MHDIETDKSVLDLEILYDIYGERNKEVVEFALGIFKRESTGYLMEIIEFIKHKDAESVSAKFHSLKTMSAMVGAIYPSELCSDLEQSTFDTEEYWQKLEHFQKVWAKLLTEVEKALG